MLASSQTTQGVFLVSNQSRKRPQFRLGIRWIIFVSLLFASVLPVVGLYKWMEHSAIQKEIAYVDQNHLIIARNLAAAMDRYARDVASVFVLVTKELQASVILDLSETLDDFDLRAVALVDRNDIILREVEGVRSATAQNLLPEQWESLRALADTSPNQPVFSGVRAFDGTPHLFVVSSLPEGRLSVAILEPRYLIELQKSIEFGERGHSMMVDQDGIVIAHPNHEWQASSKDASKLSVVQQMMAGETGVATFYSPPMQADMISGFTFSERTGWGVMVPQPMSELLDRAKSSQTTAFGIVFIEVALLVVLSWWLSNLISRPIGNVVATANAVSAGDLDARVIEKNARFAISEVQALGTTFNQVLTDMQSDRDSLANSLDAAQEGARAKSRFLMVMSHEIRTPMHGLKGILELMEESDLDADQQQLLSVGQKAANSMVSLLDSVLNFVRLEAGVESSKIAAFNLAEVTQNTVDVLQPLALQKGLSLTTNVSDGMLNSDPQMIEQILLNLVGNAIKFTNEGRVHISSELRECEVGAKHLVLSVSDSGIGIPEDLHASVFDEFKRVDSELARKQEGTGLGLSISCRLAKILNGKITLTSEPGKGSCFQLIIPISEGIT